MTDMFVRGIAEIREPDYWCTDSDRYEINDELTAGPHAACRSNARLFTHNGALAGNLEAGAEV